jgi:hypothetical protein
MNNEELLEKLEKWEYFSFRGEYAYAQYVIQEILACLRNDKKESERLSKIINKFYNPELHQKYKEKDYQFYFCEE